MSGGLHTTKLYGVIVQCLRHYIPIGIIMIPPARASPLSVGALLPLTITINIIWSMDISISIKHTCDKDMWQVTLWQLPRMRKTIISHVDRCHYVDTHSKCTVRLMYLPALPVRNACLLKRMKWFIIIFYCCGAWIEQPFHANSSNWAQFISRHDQSSSSSSMSIDLSLVIYRMADVNTQKMTLIDVSNWLCKYVQPASEQTHCPIHNYFQ